MKLLAAMLLILITITACKRQDMSEEQQLKQYRDSPAYKVYQYISTETIQLMLDSSNNKRFNEKNMHGLLSLFWLTKNAPQCAYMEAEKFSELQKGKHASLALAIRTIAFDKMEWRGLASKEYAKLKSLLAEYERDDDSDIIDRKMALLAQIMVGLHRRDDKMSMAGAKSYDKLGSTDYMASFVAIAIDAREGRAAAANKRLEEMRNKPGLSERKKALLDKGQMVLGQMKNQGRLTDQEIERLTDALINTVLASMAGDGKLGAILSRLQ